MSVLLITYDLNKPDKDYSGLYKKLKSYNYTMLCESSYAIETNDTPDVVYENLRTCFDINDHLFILTIKSPWKGWGLEKVKKWLLQRL